MKNIRIGIDLDGVVCNNMPTWSRVMNANVPVCHENLLSGSRAEQWDSPYQACARCFDAAIKSPEVVADYELEPHAAYVIDLLYRAGISMIVITSRPEEVRYATVNYLRDQRLLQYFEAVRFADDKVPVAEEENLDYMLDDRDKNILAFKGSTVVPVVFDQPYNRDLPKTYLRVKDWIDFGNFIVGEQLA